MYSMPNFYSEGLLAQHPTPRLEDSPPLSVFYALFDMYAAIYSVYLEFISSSHNLRACHAAMIRDPLNVGSSKFKS